MRKLTSLLHLRKKSIFFAGGFLLLVIVLLLKGGSSFKSVPQTSMKVGQYLVELREEGFFPNRLIVQVGETVTFKTVKKQPFWPASDFHPTHNLYPEFDAKKPIQVSSSWSFIAKKTGHWNYHDHLNPQFTGTVIVKDKKTISYLFAQDKSLDASCVDNSKPSIQCWAKLIRSSARKSSPSEAMDLIAKFYKEEPTFVNYCHEVSHIVGEEAYLQIARGKKIIFGDKTHYCSYGFYHGFTETLFARKADVSLAVKLCDEIALETSNAGQGCYHGVGHGIMDQHILRPVDDIVPIIISSLDLCKKISKDELAYTACSSGVFNAVGVYYITYYDTSSYRSNDPYYICKKIGRFERNCYWYLTEVIYEFWNYDFNKSRDVVFSLWKQNDISGDIVHISMNLLGYVLARDGKDKEAVVQKGIDSCLSLNSEFQFSCIEGFVHGLIGTSQPNFEYVSVFAFCGSDRFTTSVQQKCYKQGFNGLKSLYSQEKITSLCLSLPFNVQSSCK